MPASSSTPTARVLFARRLKALRIPRGFATARSFAQALNIDENRYTRYERAEVEPDLGLISRICSLLGVTPNELLDYAPSNLTPAGFAEGTAPPPAPPDSMNGTCSPRQALTWQLADELAKLDAPPGSNAFDRLTRKSKLYAQIEADTFAYIAHMATDRRISSLDAACASRIAEVAEQLMNALNTEILGRSGHR